MGGLVVQPDQGSLNDLAVRLQRARQQPMPPEVAAPVGLPAQPTDLSVVPSKSAPIVFGPHGQVTGPVPPKGTLEGNKIERTRLANSGAGVDQISSRVQDTAFGQAHPLGAKVLGGLAQGVAKLGDVGLSAIAPTLAINLPGTEYHHMMLEHQLNKQIAGQEEGQQREAQAGLESAQAEQIPVTGQREQTQLEGQLAENGLKVGEDGKIVPQEPHEWSPSYKASQELKAAQIQNLLDPQAKTAFEAWQKQNPSAPVEDFLKLQTGNKTPPHITAMMGGQPHIMERDPATGNYSIDRGIAPPNYAMMGGTFRLAPPLLDTKNGNAPSIMTVDQLNEANAKEPGRFIPAGVGEKALGRTALIEDIRGNINSVRDVLKNQKLPEFSPAQRAKLAVVLGGGEKGAIDAMVTGEFMNSLSPEQQDYVIGLSQLVENAMAMRSVLGAGQGSEQLRDAIRRTIPTAANPNPQYSLKQLDAFEAVINRLEKGIPTVKLAGQQNAAQFEVPKDAPAAPRQDGKYLYGADGNAIAKSQGGKWVAP